MYIEKNTFMDRSGNCDILNCVNCSTRTPIFSYLNDDELRVIDNHRTEVEYKKDELIHKSGTGSSHVISFTSGLAKLYIEDTKGNSKIVMLLKDGDFFVSPGVFSDHKHHFSVKAITNSRVCLIEAESFKSIMEKNSNFAFEYINLINQTLMQITEKMYKMVKKHNNGKIADTILYLESTIFKKNPFKLTLNSKDFADLSGVGRDASNRILNDFRSEGIIEYDKNQILIKDKDRLEQISENA